MNLLRLLAPVKRASAALDAVSVLVTGRRQAAVTKVKTLVPVVVFVQASKADKTHCTVVCQNADSSTQLVKSMR
ncbi:hypothetical protein PDENDC454_10000 [Paenibacillus dendritiformis C454]|uniref:Uncharacterized protein n=1 Tax=Paenibacillus dendritiformis C454 TaxID=1131935 RepID=H3SEN9_9BACL|nr:hypothetical protein PDENDC454_10000 [Paenibacillus dendritiformis C454]